MKYKWVWFLIAIILIVGMSIFTHHPKSHELPIGVYKDSLQYKEKPQVYRLNVVCKYPMKKIVIQWLNNSIHPKKQTVTGSLGKHFIRSYQNSKIMSAKYSITIFTNNGAEYITSTKNHTALIKTIHSPNK